MWLFLLLSGTFFIVKFIFNFKLSMQEIILAPGQLWRSVHMEKSYFGKADYPVLNNGELTSRSCPGAKQAHLNSNRRQTVDRGKVNPEVIDLP